MEYGYSCRDSQAALHLVNQHCAEARRFVNYYSYAVNSYQHALNICYQFGFEETASEILCELSMIATKYGLFEDALQYARKCDPTYAKGYLAQAHACEGLCRCRPGGHVWQYLENSFNNYARYFQMTMNYEAIFQALKLATEFDVPINKALMDSAKSNILKIIKNVVQKEWCTAKQLQALLNVDTNATSSLRLSHILCLKGLEPNILRDLIKMGVMVTTDDFEGAISVLSDKNVDLIKVLTSEVKGSPDYIGLWYQTSKDKPALAGHFFTCWAQSNTKTELDSKCSEDFSWMCDCVAKKCNSHERTNLVEKAIEKGDGHFAVQLLSGGPVIGSEISLCQLFSYLAQPVFQLSVASSILSHLLEQGISFDSSCNSSLKLIECILMDKNSDTSKKVFFLDALLKNQCSIDGINLESTSLSRVLCLKKLGPNELKVLIEKGINVTADNFEDAIKVLSDKNVDLIKVLTSKVKGSPDYIGLWYHTSKDKPVLARHFFTCWAQSDTKSELDSDLKHSEDFTWMCDCVAKKCNSHERTNLVKKAIEKGDGCFADQLLSGGPVIGSKINICLLLSYLAQPVFRLSVASSILTRLLKQGISFEGTCHSSLKPIQCILMDKQSDTLKKSSFLRILLNHGCSFDTVDLEIMQSTTIHEITKICLETVDEGLLQLACSRCTFPENGKVVNEQGDSPLHFAANAEYSEASKEICQTLCKHIDPHIEDRSGNTALQLIAKGKKLKKKKGHSKTDERFNILYKAQQRLSKESKTIKCTKKENVLQDIASSETMVMAQNSCTSHCDLLGNDPLDAHINRLKAKEPSYFTQEPKNHSITAERHINKEGNMPVEAQGTTKDVPEYEANTMLHLNPGDGLDYTEGTSANIPQYEANIVQHLNPGDKRNDTQGTSADGLQKANAVQHMSQKGDDQFDFNNYPWEVECTENVFKFLKSKHPLKYKVVENICRIANGEFHKKLCKTVCSSIKLYEAKITKDVRMLWEVAVQFSPRCTGQGSSSHVFSEVIRVWGVVLDHDDINHNIRMIQKSHADGQNAAIRIALHSAKQEECKTHSRDRMPRTFTLVEEGTIKEKDDINFVPCARLQSTEHNVITFYTLSSATVKCVLTGENIRRDFPFKVWHEEHDIINQPYGKSAILLQGRSGTGKTTCCLYRLWNQFHSYWIHNCVKNPVLTRESMLSISAHPETACVESAAGAVLIAKTFNSCESPKSKYSFSQSHPLLEHLHQVFVTKNPILCAQMKKRFYNLAAGSEFCKLHVPFEDYCIPTRLADVEDLAYPLFITARQFYVILDNSLGEDETFFPHLEDGTLNVKISSSDYDQGSEECLLDLDDSDTDDDLGFEQDDKHSVDHTKVQSTIKNRLTEISSLYFIEHIWPEIRKKSSSPHVKSLDPQLVWMEIKSTIKGSVQAMKNGNGYLSLEEYEEVGKKMAPNFVGKRADIYKLFEYYQEYLKQQRYNKSLFDECDLLHSLHQRLSKLEDLGWSIHHFFIDEVQDFTQAELALFVRTCRDPNGLFLTGDSAQSIMRGIAFRFSDVSTIFHDMQELTRDKRCATQVRTPNIAQLTINFRSHTGILNLASSVIDLLKNYFPLSFDHLHGDQGMFVGPMPVLLHTCVASDLALLLRGNKREKSQIEFGAHQAIIVQSESAKSQIPEELQGAIVLTVFESKGLEFDDVLLYNFFNDTVVDKEWRVVSEFLQCNSDLVKNNEKVFLQPHPLEFDELQHKSLNSELKYLYTAITRAKCNLWIYDCNERKRLPLFDYWLKRDLVKVVTSYDSVTNEETLFSHTSNPKEWRKQGDYFTKKGLWEPAMKCYHKAGDKHLEMEAKAFSLLKKKKTQSSNQDESNKLYTMAAIAFLDSDEAKHDPSKEHILCAAKCLNNARNYGKAAELYRLLGKHDEQVSIERQKIFNLRDIRKIPSMMNSNIDGKSQEVQQETVLQMHAAGNQKIDEEVEETIEIPGMNMLKKQHTKTGRGKRKQQ